MSLVGMHDLFAEEYWTDFNTYSSSGICDKKWINVRQDIKDTHEDSSYWLQHMEECFSSSRFDFSHFVKYMFYYVYL